jgi:hypothetical protein
MSYNKEQTTFIEVNKVDFSALKFSNTKQTAGRRFLNMYYLKKNLGLKLPKLRIPFDTKVSNYGQLEVNFSLGDNQELIKKIKDLDSKMVVFAEENNWHNGECEYTPMLKLSKNNAFPPTIRIKIPLKNDTIEAKFFDSEKVQLSIKNSDDVCNLLVKGTHALSAIQCLGIWFNADRWGLTWKVCQIRLEKIGKREVLEDSCFMSDSDNSIDSDTELLIQDEDE